MEDLEAHLTGIIYWVSPHKTLGKKFVPGKSYRALAKLTFDWDLSYTVSFNFAPYPVYTKNSNFVRLSLPFVEDEKIFAKCKQADVVILDGYSVIAICKELEVAPLGTHMGDDWTK